MLLPVLYGVSKVFYGSEVEHTVWKQSSRAHRSIWEWQRWNNWRYYI